MLETNGRVRETISEEIMLGRLAQSEQMREFFIQMWLQNPALAKQGGDRVQALMAPLERADGKETGSMHSALEATKQRGISLVELIMFIVIVGVALAGILLVMDTTTKSSADPLIRKQALAIAESLLEEVELMPFTYCDPDDPAAGLITTTSAAQCTGGAVGANDENTAIGPEGAASVGGAEGRYAAPRFDNVSDYNGFAMAAGALLDITGAAVGPAAGYSASIAVTRTGAALL